jgi:hypothetical protein
VKIPNLLVLLLFSLTIFSYAFTVNSSNSSLILQDKPWVADASSKKLKNPTAGENHLSRKESHYTRAGVLYAMVKAEPVMDPDQKH